MKTSLSELAQNLQYELTGDKTTLIHSDPSKLIYALFVWLSTPCKAESLLTQSKDMLIRLAGYSKLAKGERLSDSPC